MELLFLKKNDLSQNWTHTQTHRHTHKRQNIIQINSLNEIILWDYLNFCCWINIIIIIYNVWYDWAVVVLYLFRINDWCLNKSKMYTHIFYDINNWIAEYIPIEFIIHIIINFCFWFNSVSNMLGMSAIFNFIKVLRYKYCMKCIFLLLLLFECKLETEST